MILFTGVEVRKLKVNFTDYKTIELTRGFEAIIDLDDYERVSKRKWHSMGKEPYIYAASGYTVSKNRIAKGHTNKNNFVTLHRFIANAPEGTVVDHINRNTLDNRKSNLRVCSHSDNLKNLKVFKVKFKGVSKDNKRGTFTVGLGKIKLRGFATESDAARAYDMIAKNIYKEYAYLNNVGNKIF
jgi:hypothetical protein